MKRVLLLALAACGDTEPPVAGGHCEYAAFTQPCRFVAADRTGEHTTLWYTLEPGSQRRDMKIDIDGVSDAREARIEAHLRTHPDATCGGQRIISGTCTPITGVVQPSTSLPP